MVTSSPPPQAQQSNRVCNALALLQCVASHPETRSQFLNGLSYACTHSQATVKREILAVVLIWRFGDFRINRQIKNRQLIVQCTCSISYAYKSPNSPIAHFGYFAKMPKFSVIQYVVGTCLTYVSMCIHVSCHKDNVVVLPWRHLIHVPLVDS